MLSLGAVRVGSKIIWREVPHEVVAVQHLNMGRGQAKLVTKLRNLLSGAIVDQTFSGNDMVEEAPTQLRDAQFLYVEGQTANFMLDQTYEQLSCPLLPDKNRWLKEGEKVVLTIWHDQVIEVKLPPKVDLEVTYAEPAVKGDTANAPTKNATLETGATVQVPLFVKTGDVIRVNTETGSYVARAT